MAIVLVVVALVAVRILSTRTVGAGAPNQPAPDSIVNAVTQISPALFEKVGRGSLETLPTPVRADVNRGQRGLPVITYVGAEYCPFCAGERWALIAALGRFGTFSGLELSHSSTTDAYPNTATFSFVNATYSSPYVEFSPVELQTNVPSGNGYTQLQTPTPAQTSRIRAYDGPPYFPGQGAIPFIDFAGQYVTSGASFDMGLLRGMTQEQIAAALSNTSTAQSQGILGSANALTAAICSITGDNPADVCGQPTIKSLEGSLAAAPVPNRT